MKLTVVFIPRYYQLVIALWYRGKYIEIRVIPTITPKNMMISRSIMLLSLEVLYSTSSMY